MSPDRKPSLGDFSLDLDWEEVFDLMFHKAAIWQLVFLLGATLLVSMWNLDSLRLFTLEAIGAEHLSRMEAALEDPDDDVAAAACYTLLIEGEGAIPSQLERMLYQRPYVADACLEKASETIAERRAKGQKEPERAWRHNPFVERKIELVPRHELIASTLGRRWMSDLFDGSHQGCATAMHARGALEHARLDPTYRLMSCAVAADSAEVRECCVKQLGGHEIFVEVLDQPERAPLLDVSYDFSALAGASFPSVPLASTKLAEQNGVAPGSAQAAGNGEERFNELQADVQDWVVELGCRLHLEAPERQQTAEVFVPLIESPQCAPTDVPWSGMYSATSWSTMCREMYAYRREKLAYTPRESICDSLKAASVGQVITVAGFDVAGALSQARQVRGVRREELELVGDEFGSRLFGYRHGEVQDEHEEPESNWKDDGVLSPLE